MKPTMRGPRKFVRSVSKKGAIEIRSGPWKWSLTEIRPWATSPVTARRLEYEDAANAINRMSHKLALDWDDYSEEAIKCLAKEPTRRRFEDDSGSIWIVYPLRQRLTMSTEPARRVSLRSLGQRSRVADLPRGRSLGDLRHQELIALVEA